MDKSEADLEMDLQQAPTGDQEGHHFMPEQNRDYPKEVEDFLQSPVLEEPETVTMEYYLVQEKLTKAQRKRRKEKLKAAARAK